MFQHPSNTAVGHTADDAAQLKAPVFITVSLIQFLKKTFNFFFQIIHWSHFFCQPLRDIAVVNGQSARFECIVQAEPLPNILWSKDGRILENSGNVQIQFRNGVCRLAVSNATSGINVKKAC